MSISWLDRLSGPILRYLGVDLEQRGTIEYAGGVVVTDDPGNEKTLVSVSAGLLPIVGIATVYGVHGEIAVDMNNANKTLANTEYVYQSIKVTSTTNFTAARTLTFPAPATAAVAYTKFVRNTQAGAFAVTVSTGAGSTVAVAQGKGQLLLFTSTGVVAIAAAV